MKVTYSELTALINKDVVKTITKTTNGELFVDILTEVKGQHIPFTSDSVLMVNNLLLTSKDTGCVLRNHKVKGPYVTYTSPVELGEIVWTIESLKSDDFTENQRYHYPKDGKNYILTVGHVSVDGDGDGEILVLDDFTDKTDMDIVEAITGNVPGKWVYIIEPYQYQTDQKRVTLSNSGLVYGNATVAMVNKTNGMYILIDDVSI